MSNAVASPMRVEGALVVRNTLLGAIQQGIGVSVGLVLTPLLLAYLGVEQYGVLLVVQMLSVSGLLGVSDLGMQASLVRYLADHHAVGDDQRFRGLLATGFAVFAAIGVVCGLIVLVIAYAVFFDVFKVPELLQAPARAALLIYASTFPFQFGIYVLKAFYIALQDFPRLKAWESLERLLYLGTLALVLALGGRLLAVVVVEQAIMIGLACVFTIVASQRYGIFTVRLSDVSLERLRAITGLSWPVFLNYLSTFIVYQRAPEVIVAAVLGPVQVAYLGILMRVPRALKAVGSAVNAAIFPSAAVLDAQNFQARLGRLVLRGGRYSYLLLTPLMVFLAYFARDLLDLWVGDRFTFLANLFRAFIIWQYVMFLILLLRSAFTRADQYWSVMGTALAGNLVFLASAVLLTLAWKDLWGIGVGLILGVAVTVGGYLRALSKTAGFSLADVWSVVVRGPVILTGAGIYALCVALSGMSSRLPVWHLALILVSVYAVHLAMVYRFGLSLPERQQIADGFRRLGGLV